MAGVVLHLPEDESVVLPGPVASRLLERGDGDATLLYIAVLQLLLMQLKRFFQNCQGKKRVLFIVFLKLTQ